MSSNDNGNENISFLTITNNCFYVNGFKNSEFCHLETTFKDAEQARTCRTAAFEQKISTYEAMARHSSIIASMILEGNNIVENV